MVTVPDLVPALGDQISCSVTYIPETVKLTVHEWSVLSRGLNFVPLTPLTDQTQLDVDMKRFYRSLRWLFKLGQRPTRLHYDDEDTIGRMFKTYRHARPPAVPLRISSHNAPSQSAVSNQTTQKPQYLTR